MFIFRPLDSKGKGTKIKIKDEVSFENINDFHPILKVRSKSAGNIVNESVIDISKLRIALYEWKLFKKTRRMVDIEILDFFNSSPHDTLAVSEIKKQVKASDASIHKALNNLVKKGLLTRPGRGTYRKHLGRL